MSDNVLGAGFSNQGAAIGLEQFLRRNGGAFKNELPGSQVPLPFKTASTLVVSNCYSVNAVDVCYVDCGLGVSDSFISVVTSGAEIGLETPSVTFADTEDVKFQDEDVDITPQEAYSGGTSLNVSGTIQNNVTTELILFQEHNLVLADSVDVQSAGAIILSELQTITNVGDCSNAQTAGAVVLVQEHNPTASNTVNVQVADAVALSQEHNLTIADSYDAQTAGAVVLSQESSLVLSDAVDAQTSETVSLLQLHTLAVSDSRDDTASPEVSMTQTGEDAVAPADSYSVTTSDLVTLSQEQNIVTADSVDGQVADAVDVFQENVLGISDSNIIQTTESVAIDTGAIADLLVVEDGTQANAADSVALSIVQRGGGQRRVYYPPVPVPQVVKELTVVYVLEVQDARQDTVTDDVELSQNVMMEVIPVSAIRQTDTGNAINFTQRRRQRFIEEDEILLLAA
jgi:hypothetical protein